MRLSFQKSPYNGLLRDNQVRLWLEDVERGSLITAAEYFRRMGFLCKTFDTTPKKLAKLDAKSAALFLQNTISHFEAKGSAGTNIKGYARALKSWWNFNDIHVMKKIRIGGSTDYTKYENEKVPSKAELEKILNAGDIRAKTGLTLMAFCGFRDETLGDFLGTDGLEVRDLPEMKIDGGRIVFEKIPTIVICRKTLSKGGHQYFSFLPEEGCQYLKQYLELRIRMGENIVPQSPVITASAHNHWKVGQHIRSTNIGDQIRKAIRRAGFQWRPYVLRRYFDTCLMVAESEGLVMRDWRVFWMGHKGDIEHVYTLNKGLHSEIVERMRQSYVKAQKHFVTIVEQTNNDQILGTFNSQFLTIVGYTKEEIEKLGDLSKLSVAQIQDLLKRKSVEALGLDGNKQKVVSVVEAKTWLSQGWEFVTHLSPHEVIIKLPS